MTYPLSDSFCLRHNAIKPPLPYFPGQQFKVRSHLPPAPPNTRNYAMYNNHDGLREREEIHPLERCFLHPPFPGTPGSQDVRLEIAKALRLEDNHSAQLAVVRVSNCASLSLPDRLVAKFYGPLYYDHEQDDADPFRCVDLAYSLEVAAYVALKELQGRFIPKFYGSYTLELPDHTKGHERYRHVRLILIECVPGISMDNLDPKEFSQTERQTLIKKVVDAESAIYERGIHHRDIHPRNVMVATSPQRPPEVFLIDFGKWTPKELERGGWPSNEPPISPWLRWHSNFHRHVNFSSWIDWDWQLWLERTYSGGRTYDDPGLLLPDWFMDRLKRPCRPADHPGVL